MDWALIDTPREEWKKNKVSFVAGKARKRGKIQNKSKKKKQKEEGNSSSSSSEECETDLLDISSEENASGSKDLSFDE